MNSSLALLLAQFHHIKLNKSLPRYRRFILPVALIVLLIQSKTREITFTVLADAFWQVAVFVATTLMIYHLFSDKISTLYVNSKGKRSQVREITVASLMGVLPGCGGAIIVITQYVSGTMSFGSVAAVLTATMGDAAFLLLATQPTTGVAMIIVCFSVGVISGAAVNAIHGPNFLRHTVKKKPQFVSTKEQPILIPKRLQVQGILWKWLMLPGAIVGLLMAGQIDITLFFGMPDQLLDTIGAVITLSFIILWAVTTEITSFESIVAEDKKARKTKAFQKVALDTNFVTSWVVVAFISFELVMLYADFDLSSLFNVFGAAAPLMGVVIGMIPGCGPQIITTSLYLSGVIPLSAQIGNAISNDGDALFPAIALSPKVALVATFYSAIPALIASYSYFLLFE